MRIVTLSLAASLGFGLFIFAAEKSVKTRAAAPSAAGSNIETIAFEPVTVIGDAHAKLSESAAAN